jgi:8-oxo-dGTP diphosphatase
MAGEAPIRVIAAVLARDDRVLVCQRPLTKRHGGLWEFPGGKLEDGETDFDAALRELREELDVRVTAVSQEEFAVVDPGSPFLIAFVRVVVEGEPVAREHLALHWGTLLDVQQLPLAPSDRRYVEWRVSETRAG